MSKHALLNEADMTNIETQGRTNVYEGPNGKLSYTYARAVFAACFDRIHRVVSLFGSDENGRSSIARSASQLLAIAQRRRIEKARPDARTDRASGICGFNLALTVSGAEEGIA